MKKILITGASRGIGKATALKLLAKGYAVIGAYHESEKGAKDLEAKYPYLRMMPVDLTDRSSTLNFIKSLKTEDFYGIVNNAGIFEEDGWNNQNTSSWDHSIHIHATAPLLIVQGLKDNIMSGGSVVNVSSTDAYFGGYLSFSYAASKAALISVTKSLAVLMGPQNIRVNAIAPGWINTDMGADATGVAKHAVDKTPLGRNGEPEEVANLISFLLSDESSFISGDIINIDGGYCAVDEVLKKESEQNLKDS